MLSDYLEEISISFPIIAQGFISYLADFLSPVVHKKDNSYYFIPSNDSYIPKLLLDFNSDKNLIKSHFKYTSNETLSVNITNITDITKKSPFPYSHLELEEVYNRTLKYGIDIKSIDHIGFNLPWFKNSIYPAIIDLRNKLKSMCLYHLFPTGEPWDFIISGKPDEISSLEPVDYDQSRKPKFEIVSFNNSSTPLIQIDIAVNSTYIELQRIFP